MDLNAAFYERTKIKRDNKKLEGKLNEEKSVNEGLKAKYWAMLAENNTLKGQLKANEKKIKQMQTLKESFAKRGQLIAQYEKRQNEVKKELEEQKKTLSTIGKNNRKWKARYAKLKGELKTAKAETRELKAKNEAHEDRIFQFECKENNVVDWLRKMETDGECSSASDDK